MIWIKVLLRNSESGSDGSDSLIIKYLLESYLNVKN